MKPKIDLEKCIGCGNCANVCPEVFELGSDGKAYIKNLKGKCDLKDAVENCPTQAISLVEE